MAFLSSVQAEINVFPVRAAAILGSDFWSDGTGFKVSPLKSPWSKIYVLDLEWFLYLVYKLRYVYFWFERQPSWVPTSGNMGQGSGFEKPIT